MALRLEILGADGARPVMDVGNPVPIVGPAAGLGVAGTVTVEQANPDSLNGNANIQVGNVDAAAGNPVPTEEQEVAPTDASKNNPSFALTYTTGDLTQIVMTIGVGVYTKTLGYTNGDLTSVSVWV